MKMLQILSLCLIFLGTVYGCIPQSGSEGYYCVCNSTYCDSIPDIGTFDELSLKIFYTSDITPGFNIKDALFTQIPDPNIFTISVTSETYQTILGFGGAFTDAGGININKLAKEAQDKLLETYFGDDGIGFTLMRVPIGVSDFSARLYTYDDTDGDRDLSQFALQDEDFQYKVIFTHF